jgi:predicted GIY-YIG superfamily endonuclease
MSQFYYEPLLCSRCKNSLENINQAHLNSKMTNCRSPKRIKGAYVYLMHDETNDLLKIGYSENPARRLKELVYGSTNTIKLIGYFPGSKTNEHIVQAKFKRQNFKREWFRNETEIIDYFQNHPEFASIDF